MDPEKKVFHLLGSIYSNIYRIPFIGNLIVRGVCRTFGLLGYLGAMRHNHYSSVEEFAGFFKTMTDAGGIEVEISSIDETQFEFSLKECPYGFNRPEQQGVCEAAMDMDRTLFGLCGFELTIKESIPGGSPVCVEHMRLKNAPEK